MLARSAGEWGPTPRRRVTAIGLTLLAELLFLIILLGLTPAMLPKAMQPPGETLINFGQEPSPPKTEQRKSIAKTKTVDQKAQPPARPRLSPPPPIAVPSPSFVPMSSADLAAADIGKLGSKAPGAASASASSGATAGPGQGPGGAQLYNAEWVVEPTDAQLNGYLKGPVDKGSWAEIACKTIAHFRVENCQPLGEYPPGSGIGRAMRQAAWQFQVRPERIDSKLLIGSWVRIRISFGEEGVKEGR